MNRVVPMDEGQPFFSFVKASAFINKCDPQCMQATDAKKLRRNIENVQESFIPYSCCGYAQRTCTHFYIV